MPRKAAFISLFVAALLWGATVINGDRSIIGRWDASGSTGTLPFQVGLAASVPATCTVGQVYFTTDGVPGRKIQSCTATNTWTPIAYDQGTSLPTACTLGQIYFRTDATPGVNLNFCTTTGNPGTWTPMSSGGGGGGGGTVNPGAGNGLYWPFGLSSFASSAAVTVANKGFRFEFCAGSQYESRYINFSMSTALTSGQGLMFTVRNHAMNSLLAVSSVLTAATTGAKQLQWVSGSDVASNVLTLPGGCYYLTVETDSTTAKWASYGDATDSAIANANSGAAYASSGSATSTGTGSGLAPITDVSGSVWTALSNQATPIVAIRN